MLASAILLAACVGVIVYLYRKGSTEYRDGYLKGYCKGFGDGLAQNDEYILFADTTLDPEAIQDIAENSYETEGVRDNG